ncbi:MAG: SlyX family protein [Hahellaceae bacterium]|nr:SlyX family protein [Hahellaceae bacterium]
MNSCEEMEQRIIELEMRVAFQDDLLTTLNNVLSKQQRDMENLWSANRILRNQMNSLQENIKPDSEEAPPPHY